MPRWTLEQQQAINEEGSNILVSAGAGSGKTAVLSERALRKVKNGVDIDKILILTFTKAAAYEMMVRIRKKISDAGLKEQVSRIDKAYITTFDSFALSIVKKYHDRLNITKNVSIVDSNVIMINKKKILDEIFDNYYTNSDPDFEKLITDFCLRDDKEIKEYILSLNDKLDLKYDKIDYLKSYLDKFYDLKVINNRKNEYEEILKSIILKIKNSLSSLELILDGDTISLFYDNLNSLFGANDYDEIKKSLDIDLPRLPKNSGDEAKLLKKELSDFIDELKKLTIYDSSKSMVNDYLSTKDYLRIVIKIILELEQKITEYKFYNNVFEFTDISKLAIKLVKENSDIKNELKYYFNEIMIDEYQDTSDLQEEFIKEIENDNVYMVGDIKQSIYRFRNANPLLFKDKYDRYSTSSGGIKIDLNKNFRSRDEVLKNINDIFDLIMDNKFGGAEYKQTHQMIFGNNTYINEGKTEQNYNIDFYKYHIDKDSNYSKYKTNEIEAFIIASDIKEKVDEHFKVFDKDTLELRDIKYSDFVILMDRSKDFNLYKKIFEYFKIPLTILKDENIMEQDEVFLIKNILKLIECCENKEFNNSFYYAFTSISRSYLFRVDDEEIFKQIKENNFINNPILEKVNKIVSKLSNLDLRSLIEEIIYEFDFSNKLISVGNIDMGIAVLEYFLNLSKSLQDLGYDYHDFINYLDEVIKNKSDIRIPVSINDEDSAKIMTIHKSKGLEYPICYYSGLANSFNVSELKEKILYDNEYGIITPSFYLGYQDTFYKELLKKKYYLEEIGEKIRLFYVALTRCKEKMIVVADLEENATYLDSGLVSDNNREKYRSFLDILKSIYEEIESYVVPINLDNIEITDKYKILTTNNQITDIKENELVVSEYINNEIVEVEKTHFSKMVVELIDKNTLNNMRFGVRIHEIFEMIDFKNPKLDKLDITDFERKCITNFLNQDILKDIDNAKILKEYEFYTKSNDNQECHGIIDLMIEYSDRIDIIDYKLKNVSDDSYLKQLFGYRDYIVNKTKKRVNVYLYSILNNELKELKID